MTEFNISYGITDRDAAFRPGEGIQCQAKVKYQLQWTGTTEDLISLANNLHMDMTSYPLDSYDAGDAMGALMKFCNDEGEGEFEMETPLGTLRMTTVPDLFEWEGLPSSHDEGCQGV